MNLTNPVLKEAQKWTALHLCRVDCHGATMVEGSGDSHLRVETHPDEKRYVLMSWVKFTNAFNSLGSAEESIEAEQK